MAILGIDEVGRGVWAGPLVVGAVVLGEAKIEGLCDSKVLSEKKREELNWVIRREAAGFGLGWVWAWEVDRFGLSEALRLATRRAVEKIRAPYHEIIIDGTVNFLAGTSKGEFVTTMKKGDQLISAVSAAAILAKHARDVYMAGRGMELAGWGFEDHKGYGTAAHRAAIEELGVTDEHRRSVRPVREYLERVSSKSIFSSHQRTSKMSYAGKLAEPPQKRRTCQLRQEYTFSKFDGEKMTRKNGFDDRNRRRTTKEIGDRAEGVVCGYLERLGHRIVERNWRTRWCEIDVVSERKGAIYFTEVKYRRTSERGGGVDAVTERKLEQMRKAAETYLNERDFEGEVFLAVASVAGEDFVMEEWIVL